MCRSEKIVSTEDSLHEEKEMELDLDITQDWINHDAVDRARSALHRFLTQLQKTSHGEKNTNALSATLTSPLKREMKDDADLEYLNEAPSVCKYPRRV